MPPFANRREELPWEKKYAQSAEIILKEIEDLYSYGKDGEAGYACTLKAEEKCIGTEPGDLIVKD